MKTNKATLNFIQRAKVLSDGTSPIMLVCRWNKKTKEMATGVSILPKHWNKGAQCVRKSHKDADKYNKHLYDLMHKYTSRRDELFSSGIEYSCEDVLSDEKIEKGDKRVVLFSSLVDEYIINRSLSYHTSNSYRYVANLFKRFSGGEDMDIRKIDSLRLQGFFKVLPIDGLSAGTIKEIFHKMTALLSYAVSVGYISSNPLSSWTRSMKPKGGVSVKKQMYIPSDIIAWMKNELLERMVVMDGDNGWHFRDGVIDELNDRSSQLFCFYFYMFIYLMQGLSPIDCSLLKRDMVRVVNVNGVDYYAIDTVRRKTGVSVKIRFKVDDLYNRVMMDACFVRGGEYLLPILEGVDVMSEKKVIMRCTRVLCYNNLKLREGVWKDLNEKLSACGMRTIDEGCTYYSARHSYAMAYLQSPGANVVALASLLGRSVNSIGAYLAELRGDEDIVSAVSVMA